MRIACRLALLAALATGSVALGAQDSSWTLSGTVERSDAALWTEADGFAWSGQSAAELGLSVAGDGTRGEAAARLTLLNGAGAERLLVALDASGDPTIPGMLGGALVLPLDGLEAQTALLVELRSLQVRLDLGATRLRAGRQVVNLGRAQAFSPADVFSARDLSGLTPERSPVDALRVSGALGGLGGWDLIAAPRADPAEGRYAGRVYGYLAGVDGSLLAGRDGAAGDWLGAADLQFDLGATVRGELLLRVSDSNDARLSASGGIDWSLGDLVMAAEYYRNGEGLSGAVALSETGPFDSANYGFMSLSYPLGDFVALLASALADFDAGLWAPALSASFDAAQNARVLLSLRGLARAQSLESAALAATLSLRF